MSIQFDDNHRLITDPELFDERRKGHIIGIKARKAELLEAIEFLKTMQKD